MVVHEVVVFRAVLLNMIFVPKFDSISHELERVQKDMSEIPWQNFEAWVAQVPDVITSDPLWDLETYRRALFFSDLAWFDSEKLLDEPRGKRLAWQLVDSAGSVPANIEEGYSRGFGKDYARFLRISLGSCREARGWYYRGRHVFTPEAVNHRLNLATEIMKSLTNLAKQQRNYHK